jgi:hypothetical membrane protein
MGFCGLIAPILAFSLIALAISRSPWFSWTGNALSDLGVGVESALLFNSGLIAAGALIVAFALGLHSSLRGKTLGNAGGIALALAGVALCAIGIFPETSGDIHFYVSVAFFALLVISLWLVGAALMRLGEKKLGFLIVIAGVLAGLVWVFPWPAVAIPEAIASLAASACCVALSIKLLIKPNKRAVFHQVGGTKG